MVVLGKGKHAQTKGQLSGMLLFPSLPSAHLI